MDRTVMTSLGEVQVLERLRVRTQDLYPELVEDYVEALREGAVLPPVQVAQLADRLVLIDGRHRIAAWMALDMPVSAELVGECSEAEALALALAANMRHGMRRNQGDVARCIHLALAMWPGSSNREIARRVGCSHTRVNQVVAEALPVERSFHSKVLEGSDVELGSAPNAPAWRSPWTPESFQVVDEPWDDAQIDGARQRAATMAIGVDHGSESPSRATTVIGSDGLSVWPGGTVTQDISFADRMTELWGEEPEAAKEPVACLHKSRGEFVTVDQTATSSVEVEPVFVDEAPVVGPKRHRGQDPLERWYTDEGLATVCWRWLLGLGLVKARKGVIQALEPAVGDGVWITSAAVAAAQMGQRLVIGWEACDLDPNAKGEGLVGTLIDDFLEVSWSRTFDLVITNPPNSKAFEFAKRALELVKPDGVVAFLMPLSWYAAQGRRVWLEEHPPYRVGVCPWRPSFGGPAAELQGTGNGTPTQVYALFVWVAGYQGETVLEIIPGSEVEDGEE